MPRTVANTIIKRLDGAENKGNRIKWAIFGILIAMGIMSQNLGLYFSPGQRPLQAIKKQLEISAPVKLFLMVLPKT
ncbi:hypothetical protein [Oligella ureolytica]|uniref:hypothetical protein n=1 Tax=Oligella ureolytica TaxID=90244 RepID=UPI00215D991E|nr:hypothetical protein [Oligella ureolytica]